MKTEKDFKYGMFLGITISAIIYTLFETFISKKYQSLEVLRYFIFPVIIMGYFIISMIKDKSKKE